MTTAHQIDPTKFRQVLGQYPTGVVVVTALDAEGEAVGMTVGSFTSVSLDPPLVAFLPAKSSSSWRALRASGDTFCVNILGAHQEPTCRAVAMRKENKFDGIDWAPSPALGNPVIDGAVAYIDCIRDAVHDAGDHEIVVGSVQDIEIANPTQPLLFFRGGYGSFTPLSLAAGDADLLDQLRLVDLARPHMEALAARFDSEVTAITLVRNELVLAASAGHVQDAVAPTRVGQRVPFMPPLGSVFAAFGGSGCADAWLQELAPDDSSEGAGTYRDLLESVRERGYSITVGHEASARLDALLVRAQDADPVVTAETIRASIRATSQYYNPDLPEGTQCELRSLSAPVFDSQGRVVFALGLWGPRGTIAVEEVHRYAEGLLGAAAETTKALAVVGAARTAHPTQHHQDAQKERR